MSEVVRLAPIKRIEGHGRVSLFLGDDGKVTDAHFDVIEFRGFEKFLEGRMVWEMPLITSRVCGICPVTHHVAAAKATDAMFGVELPRTAVLLRTLLQLAGFVHDHALHFFFLAGPDFLTGDGASRDLLGVLGAMPEQAVKAVGIRKTGQKVVDAVGGQGHPVTAIPGGMSIGINEATRLELLADCQSVLPDAQAAERLAREATLRLLEANPRFAESPTPYMSLVAENSVFDLYDGAITAIDGRGALIDVFRPGEYEQHLSERVLPYSYAKVPYLTKLGPEDGTYRVGPLARLNIAKSVGTPLADALHKEFHADLGETVHRTLAYHWARMIELVAALEHMIELLSDRDITGKDYRVRVERGGGVGIAAVEAPRGTLIHHYEADEVGRVTRANLIVATTHNNRAIDRAVLEATAGRVFEGALDEATFRRMELGIRAYDPCLSCATHEVGRMPLSVQVIGPDGSIVAEGVR